MRLDRTRKVVDVDDDLLDARGFQPVEHVIDQRTSGNFDKRLGPRGRERSHPLAQPGGQDHRGLRHFRFYLGTKP